MKLTELISVGEPAVLWHGDYGFVDWMDHFANGWGLYWHRGHDKGQPLWADDIVLFSDRWELRSPDDDGKRTSTGS